MLYADPALADSALRFLENSFGDILLASPGLAWDHSRFYEDELGWPITRKFVLFDRLLDPSELPDIKRETNEMERAFAHEGRRKVNLDPGYLTLSKIVLASTKNYAHRIYLRDGIYAEVTLYFRGGTYVPHLFTYRDYREKNAIDFFLSARQLFRQRFAQRT